MKQTYRLRSDAQPFNREDAPRQAGSRLSSQTLGGGKFETHSLLPASFRGAHVCVLCHRRSCWVVPARRWGRRLHTRSPSSVHARLWWFAWLAASSVLRNLWCVWRQALFLVGRAGSGRQVALVVSVRLRASRAILLRSAAHGFATVRSGIRQRRSVLVRRLTLQSRGHAPASRVMPLISNVELNR